MRFLELFAGAGGLSLGLERAGLVCVAHAELDDFPRRILSARWPGLPLYGDVLTLDGRRVVEECGPIDMVTGGSPCQDLSVAGKRAGLHGARSGLFAQQMRLWDETGADLCLWENVIGAMSSRNGRDFAAVLSAFVGGTVLVPRDGWVGERCSGVVSGPSGVAAWRILDAQYFGVPQRRRRVFVLGARAGRVDPAQVLLEPEGVRWNPPTRGTPGQGAPGGAGDGAAIPLDVRNATRTTEPDEQNRQGCGVGEEGDPSPTLTGMFTPAVLAFMQDQTGRIGVQDDLAYSLGVSSNPSATGVPKVLAFDLAQITSAHNRGSGAVHVCAADDTGLARCVTAGEGGRLDWETTTVVVANSLRHKTHPTSRAGEGEIIVGTLTGNGDAHKGFRDADGLAVSVGIPRRLMPVECERLMGWPDGWTDIEGASDARRYKAIGNGVASPVAEWIGRRLMVEHADTDRHKERHNGAIVLATSIDVPEDDPHECRRSGSNGTDSPVERGGLAGDAAEIPPCRAVGARTATENAYAPVAWLPGGSHYVGSGA